MGDTRSALAADCELSAAGDLDETRSILADAGIDSMPQANADPLQPPDDFSVADAGAALDQPHEAVTAQPEAEDLRFGWAYPDTASADDLIIGSDGTGYLYPSDFVHGTNGYEPD